MSDLFDEPDRAGSDRAGSDRSGSGATGNAPEFTVGELAGAVRRTIEGAFSRVRVRGEVGRVSRPASGHIYFDLKEDRAVVAAVAWKGVAGRLRHLPEEGMEVVATGRLSTFGPQSKYQLIVDDVAPAGLGALMAMLEARRKSLAAEGLFDPARKRSIPHLPHAIGVVTSPSGAVIRDILHRIRERFPVPVYIWPVTVQGERCAPEVAAAIRGFDALDANGPVPRPDVLIVARGGGSLEDLWGFNEEAVVRAVAACSIPVISAVGHETDTTLIDHVSDLRAPTPTAAAERAVPVRMDLLAAVAGLEDRRVRAMTRLLEARGQRLRDLGRLLPRPAALVAERAQMLDGLSVRLPQALRGMAQARRGQLGQAVGRFGPGLLQGFLARLTERVNARADRLAPGLMARSGRARDRLEAARLTPAVLARGLREERRREARVSAALAGVAVRRMRELRAELEGLERMRAGLGHEATLRRGFAIVRGADGVVTPDRAAAAQAGALELEFRDGRMAVGPTGGPTGGPKGGGAAAKAASKSAPKPRKPGGEQGSLF